MKKIIIFLFLTILFLGCTPKYEPETFEYEKDGRKYRPVLMKFLEPSMEWIDENLPEDAVITTWWDYGHTVRGKGHREAIAFNPSEEILDTVALHAIGKKFEHNRLGEFSDHEDILNTAQILTTTDPQEAIDLMEQYNSKYILVTYREYGKSRVIYGVSGIEFENIEGYAINNESLFVNILKKRVIEGFWPIYGDNASVIYKIDE